MCLVKVMLRLKAWPFFTFCIWVEDRAYSLSSFWYNQKRVLLAVTLGSCTQTSWVATGRNQRTAGCAL